MIRRFARQRWLRFRPYRRKEGRYRGRNLRQDQKYIGRPQPISYRYNNRDIFDLAEQRVTMLLQRRPEVTDLDRRIGPLRARFAGTHDIIDGLAALLSQAPRAVLAQLEMDTYPHGYRNKEKRLYELIDFNDSMIAVILLLGDGMRRQFAERTKQAADRICKRVGGPAFDDEQWRAIIRGLTREVAVYQAAIDNGFDAILTDRVNDALGIDVQVRDPETGRYINIDVKTPSSFRRRMEQLVREKRLDNNGLMLGDQNSYIIEFNGHGKRRTKVIVLCILPDKFGDLTDWRFVDSGPMRAMLNRLIREHGMYDKRFGVSFL